MQDIIFGLFMVLGPMFLGYLIKIRQARFLSQINRIVMALLYVILFVMGFMLGQLDELGKMLPIIGGTALALSAIILTCNIAGLMLYDRYNPAGEIKPEGKIISRWHSLLDSFKLSFSVVLGILTGWFCVPYFSLPHGSNLWILILLIFFVGIQLRNNGIALKEVLLNKRGLHMGLIFTITSFIGGILSSWLLNMPWVQGLGFASGFGWYSLSSVVLTNAWGPVQGSIAFFNDLSREIVSLFAIPIFMRYYCSTAIGITGATAIDCTLPIIQKAGGIAVTPIAISFGVVTNLLPPILLVFFSSIPL